MGIIDADCFFFILANTDNIVCRNKNLKIYFLRLLDVPVKFFDLFYPRPPIMVCVDYLYFAVLLIKLLCLIVDVVDTT